MCFIAAQRPRRQLAVKVSLMGSCFVLTHRRRPHMPPVNGGDVLQASYHFLSLPACRPSPTNVATSLTF